MRLRSTGPRAVRVKVATHKLSVLASAADDNAVRTRSDCARSGKEVNVLVIRSSVTHGISVGWEEGGEGGEMKRCLRLGRDGEELQERCLGRRGVLRGCWRCWSKRREQECEQVGNETSLGREIEEEQREVKFSNDCSRAMGRAVALPRHSYGLCDHP